MHGDSIVVDFVNLCYNIYGRSSYPLSHIRVDKSYGRMPNKSNGIQCTTFVSSDPKINIRFDTVSLSSPKITKVAA